MARRAVCASLSAGFGNGGARSEGVCGGRRRRRSGPSGDGVPGSTAARGACVSNVSILVGVPASMRSRHDASMSIPSCISRTACALVPHPTRYRYGRLSQSETPGQAGSVCSRQSRIDVPVASGMYRGGVARRATQFTVNRHARCRRHRERRGRQGLPACPCAAPPRVGAVSRLSGLSHARGNARRAFMESS